MSIFSRLTRAIRTTLTGSPSKKPLPLQPIHAPSIHYSIVGALHDIPGMERPRQHPPPLRAELPLPPILAPSIYTSIVGCMHTVPLTEDEERYLRVTWARQFEEFETERRREEEEEFDQEENQRKAQVDSYRREASTQ